MNILIRPATSADIPTLSGLKHDTYRETFIEGFRIPYPPEDVAAFEVEAYGEPRVAAELADPDHRTWLAERDGALVGYVHVGPCKLPHPDVRRGDGEIYQLYVSQGAQGHGLGQRLFEIALDWLGETRCHTIWLGVWSGNDKAQRFYRHHGFEKAGEYLFPVGSWHDQEYIYRRS